MSERGICSFKIFKLLTARTQAGRTKGSRLVKLSELSEVIDHQLGRLQGFRYNMLKKSNNNMKQQTGLKHGISYGQRKIQPCMCRSSKS